MLLGDDVVDLMRRFGEILRHLTVFAARRRALPDL
jgi:hypothetical protein